jgi:hypothetical protein
MNRRQRLRGSRSLFRNSIRNLARSTRAVRSKSSEQVCNKNQSLNTNTKPSVINADDRKGDLLGGAVDRCENSLGGSERVYQMDIETKLVDGRLYEDGIAKVRPRLQFNTVSAMGGGRQAHSGQAERLTCISCPLLGLER